MILSDKEIKRLIKEGKLKITPLKKGQIGPASVDLTLGNEWWFFKEKYIRGLVDLKEIPFHKALKKIKADAVILQPGEMCLGKTVEKIELPPNIMGRLEGRSKYARMGLAVHITSAVVQPGSRNHQILEIVNFSPASIVLHKGMRVSQILFYRLKEDTSKPYYRYGKVAKRQ